MCWAVPGLPLPPMGRVQAGLVAHGGPRAYRGEPACHGPPPPYGPWPCAGWAGRRRLAHGGPSGVPGCLAGW